MYYRYDNASIAIFQCIYTYIYVTLIKNMHLPRLIMTNFEKLNFNLDVGR